MKKFFKGLILVILIALIGLCIAYICEPSLFDSWFGKAEDQPNKPDKPIQEEEIKDFKFSGNKITGYTGTEVNLKILPASYSVNIGDIKEVVEITVDDMSDEEAMKDFSEKVENNSFYCTLNGGERFFSVTYQEWNEYMAKHYPDGEQMKAFPMKFEFCDVTYVTGDDYQITAIANNAFAGNTIITDIAIPDHIIDIGQSAFEGCTSLINVELNNNIKTLFGSTYKDCNSLKNINLENITSFSGYATFKNCTALENVNLNDNLLRISANLFENSGLTSIKLPKELKDIEVNAFAGTNLTSIVLPDNIENIEAGAFDDTDISEIEIPAMLTSINFLYTCNSLQKVTLKSDNIQPYELVTFVDINSKIKIYVPDDYYLANYESYFEPYLDNIFPINGTYPEGPDPEPEPEPSGEIVKMDNVDNKGTTTIYLNSDVESFTMPLVIGIKYIYSDVRIYNSVDDLIADKEDLISSYQGFSYCYTEQNGSDFVLFSFGESSSIEYAVEQWLTLNNQFPFKVAKFDIEYYDMTNVSYEEQEKFISENTVTDVSKTTYSDYFSGMSLIDFTYATNLKEIILPNNPRGTSLIHSNQFATAKNVNVILESIQLLTIYDSQSVQADESVNFYVPDELYEKYLANEYWQGLADQIYKLSELV